MLPAMIHWRAFPCCPAIRAACALVAVFGALAAARAAQVGDVFPAWSEGQLDIHHINTGKGEAALFILPDGTSMLVDAGATTRPPPRVTDQRPDASRTPGAWITRYLRRMLADRPEPQLDYILLTHFHDDHMGNLPPDAPTAAGGAYRLAGITEVGDALPFDRIIDRGWDYPERPGAAYFDNYTRFVAWHVANRDVVAETFAPGRNDQIVLRRDPAAYPQFELRNLAANGRVWTGAGSAARAHFPPLESLPPADYPSENMCSIAFRLSYGPFRYFNGGDITTAAPGSWRDIETAVGRAAGPVDVCVANHHAFYDAMGAGFLEAVRPRVFIIQAWSPSHPSHSSIARMRSQRIYPGPRDVFATNVLDATRVVIGGGIDSMRSQQGHIVIRVEPGGARYWVFILDDAAESFRITAIHGPYAAG
jgi:beta-lactamase superfamily II metal-dependent hydrolase